VRFGHWRLGNSTGGNGRYFLDGSFNMAVPFLLFLIFVLILIAFPLPLQSKSQITLKIKISKTKTPPPFGSGV
jgi:hypothetical protein